LSLDKIAKYAIVFQFEIGTQAKIQAREEIQIVFTKYLYKLKVILHVPVLAVPIWL
jgi:hypothetical protein